MLRTVKSSIIAAVFGIFLIFASIANAQTDTEFSYQGRLTEGGLAANGNYDMEFVLCPDSTCQITVSNPVTLSSVAVASGIFNVTLDFGDFMTPPLPLSENGGGTTSQQFYLQVKVRPAGSTNPYTTLNPPQRILSAPRAIRSLSSGNADRLAGRFFFEFVGQNDPRLTDARQPLAGSNFYIQNGTTPQTGGNFNISGNGTLGGNLTVNGDITADNITAGGIITGDGSGLTRLNAANLFGSINDVRLSSNIPRLNAANTFTANQTFSGNVQTFNLAVTNDLSVQGDITAGNLTVDNIQGNGAGLSNLNAANISSGTISDARLSSNIPRLNQANTFTGSLTANNFTAIGSFSGSGSGLTNLNAANIATGTLDAARIPNLDAGQITSGTFGDARLSSNIPRLNAANTFSGTQSANVFNASSQFNIGGTRILSAGGTGNLFAGFGAGAVNTGQNNSFFGNLAGSSNTSGINNTFIGSNTGNTNDTGSNNTLIGAGASLGANNLTYASAIGAGATVTASNTVMLGRTQDTVFIPGDSSQVGYAFFNGGVGIDGDLTVDGKISLSIIPGGGMTPLCATLTGLLTNVSICSSSIRYKKDVENFTPGLSLIQRLRPVTFTWKSNNQRDLGFVAEEVNAVEPLMTTYNEKGEVEGVKYDRISAALVNAVNEQQAQIETQNTQVQSQKTEIETLKTQISDQQKTIERQQKQLDTLMKLICTSNSSAVVCKQEEK